MGLDLNVTLSTEKVIIKEHYYRLNWPGVSFEYKYMNYFLPLSQTFLKTNTVKQIKNKNIYYIIGRKKNYKNYSTIKYQDIIFGKNIKKGPGNTIYIKDIFKKEKISMFKIYDISHIKLTENSLISLIGFNQWGGSNGEKLIFQNKKAGIFFKNKLLISNKLFPELRDKFRHLLILMNSNNVEKYIIKNNLILVGFLKDLIDLPGAKLSVYYG